MELPTETVKMQDNEEERVQKRKSEREEGEIKAL